MRYKDDIDTALGKNTPEWANIKEDLLHAAGGDETAMQRVGPERTKIVRNLMEFIIDTANARAGRNFIKRTDWYRPRQLSKEAREYMRDKGKGLAQEHHMHDYALAGFEKQRKYVSHEQLQEMIEVEVKKGLSPEEAQQAVRKRGAQDQFMGERLMSPETHPDRLSVENQINEILDRAGVDYDLFSDDWDKVMDSYIKLVAHRTGEVYAETLLTKSGIFKRRSVNLTHIPDIGVSNSVRVVREAEEAMAGAAAHAEDALNQAIRRVGAEAAQKEQNVIERKAIMDQAEAAYEAALRHHESLVAPALEADATVGAIDARISELDAEMARLQRRLEGVDASQLAELQQRQVDIIAELNNLNSSRPRFALHLNRLRTSTAAVLEMEDKVTSIYGDEETFEFFAKIFDDHRSYEETLDEFVTARVGDDAFPEFEEGIEEIIWGADDTAVASSGKWQIRHGEKIYSSMEVHQMMEATDIYMQSLDNGQEIALGEWLGIELFLDAASPDDAGGMLRSLKYNIDRIHKEIEEATLVVDDFVGRFGNEALGGGETPTPEAVIRAKETMVRVINEKWQAAQQSGVTDGSHIWTDLWEDPTFTAASATYYNSVGNKYVGSSISSLAEMDMLLDSARAQLKREYTDATGELRSYGRTDVQVGDGSGLLYGGFGVDDYNYLSGFKAQVDGGPTGLHNPFPIKPLQPDDLFDPSRTEKLGSSLGSEKGVTADSPLGIVGGSNAGFKIRYTFPDGTSKIYYVKHAVSTGDKGKAALATSSMKGRDVGLSRISGEVLADRLYRDLDEIAGRSGDAAPISWYGYRSAEKATPEAPAGWWKITEWNDDFVQAVNVHTVEKGTMADQYRIFNFETQRYQIVIERAGVALPDDAVPMAELVSDQFGADLLLANTDVVGFSGDNIGVNAVTGEPWRMDNGASFHYRARGAPKDGGVGLEEYDWRGVYELFGQGDQRTGTFFPENTLFPDNPAGAFRFNGAMRDFMDSTEVGFTGQLQIQVERMLKLRGHYGGWDGFVLKHLPELPQPEVDMFVKWLDTRLKRMSEYLNLPYLQSEDLLKQTAASAGIPAEAIEELTTKTYGPTQKTSEFMGYEPWLSPATTQPDGSILHESQALEEFSFAKALNEVRGPQWQLNKLARERDKAVMKSLQQLEATGELEYILDTDAVLNYVGDTLFFEDAWREQGLYETAEVATQRATHNIAELKRELETLYDLGIFGRPDPSDRESGVINIVHDEFGDVTFEIHSMGLPEEQQTGGLLQQYAWGSGGTDQSYESFVEAVGDWGTTWSVTPEVAARMVEELTGLASPVARETMEAVAKAQADFAADPARILSKFSPEEIAEFEAIGSSAEEFLQFAARRELGMDLGLGGAKGTGHLAQSSAVRGLNWANQTEEVLDLIGDMVADGKFGPEVLTQYQQGLDDIAGVVKFDEDAGLWVVYSGSGSPAEGGTYQVHGEFTTEQILLFRASELVAGFSADTPSSTIAKELAEPFKALSAKKHEGEYYAIGEIVENKAPPWSTDTGNYGVVIIGGSPNDRTIRLRMPTDDPKTGQPFGGNRWTFSKGAAEKGEDPAQTAIRETWEETGLDVEIVGYLPEMPAGSTTHTHFFIGRVKTGYATKPLTSDAAFRGNVLRLNHMSNRMNYWNPAMAHGHPDQGWIDQVAPNATVLPTVAHLASSRKYGHRIQVNLGPMGGEATQIYGLPPHLRASLANIEIQRGLYDPFPETAFAAGLPKELQDLHKAEKELFDAYDWSKEAILPEQVQLSGGLMSWAKNDMKFDMLEKVHDSGDPLWEELVSRWSQPYGGERQRSNVAAAVFDTVKALRGRNLPTFNSMSWRDQVTYLGFVGGANQRQSGKLGTVAGNYHYTGRGEMRMKGGQRPPAHSPTAYTKENQKAIEEWLGALQRFQLSPSADIEHSVAQYLAFVSHRNGEDSITYWTNRMAIERGTLISDVVYRDSLWEGLVASTHSDLSKGMLAGKGGLSVGLAVSHKFTKPVTEGVSSKAYNLARFYEIWKRGLSAEGRAVVAWPNTESLNHLQFGGKAVGKKFLSAYPKAAGGGSGKLNWMLINPRAIEPDPFPLMYPAKGGAGFQHADDLGLGPPLRPDATELQRLSEQGRRNEI